MSKCFLDPLSPYFSLFEGISCLSEAYADTFSHVKSRLSLAVVDIPLVELAYTAATGDDQAGPRSQHDERILGLYSQAVGLLPLAANFGVDHAARLGALNGCDEITRGAAARAVLSGSLPQAVEMLEQGRGVFWAQTLHMRTDTFDGVPIDDCQELQRMLRLLDHGARQMESLEQSVSQHECELEKRRRLNDTVQALISKIRRYPGLDRFLLPPAFHALLASLPHGFIVIVNASNLGHHALLLHRDADLVSSLTLKLFRTGLNMANLRAQLPRDMGAWSGEADGAMSRAMRVDTGRAVDLDDILAQLWTSLVLPVLEALCLPRAERRDRPRLWWCATGQLSFLPIHAAGRYRGGNMDCTANYVISSYIPTLASLTKARRGWVSIARRDLAGLFVCEASESVGSTAYLSHALHEVLAVRQCFTSAGATVLNEPVEHTTLSDLHSLLDGTPAHVLHMACHGAQHADPLKSSFLLQDGTLAIENILQLHLPHSLLAFLSACQTAKGDHNAPDQAVHLAASMLFCDFRSVVGTMWSMEDADGPRVARHFYDSLFEKDHMDLDDIASALDEAVQALRRSKVPTSRWALFMHIGG